MFMRECVYVCVWCVYVHGLYVYVYVREYCMCAVYVRGHVRICMVYVCARASVWFTYMCGVYAVCVCVCVCVNRITVA